MDLDRLRSQIPAASSVQAQAGAAGIIKYLEDIVVGETVALGSVLIDQHDLVSFARQFDPQPFHTDPEAAAHTMSQGLIASGWHTCALAMRLLCDAAPFGSHPILGTGVDELRWPNPVRPGDVVSGTIEFLEVRPSGSKPDRGTARLRLTLHNQRGETVLAMLPRVVLMRRPAVTEEATDQAASTRCP